ncbi:MAG: glycosyltransferase [Bacteroidota bacterium]
MSRKKVLFITNQLPFPPVTGGKMKSWNLVNRLSEIYDLGLATLIKDQENKHELEFRNQVPLEHYYSEQLTIPRNAFTFMRSLFGHGSLNLYRNSSRSFNRHVKSILSNYDLVIVDHYDVYPSVMRTKDKPIILHQHNAEYCLWERMSSLEKNPIKKWVISFEANRVKNAERSFTIDADKTWAAPNDIKALMALGVEREKFETTYHLGDDHLMHLPLVEYTNTKKNILFVGTQSWEANIHGMEWFLNKVWPKVKSKDQEIQLIIIGKNPSSRLTQLTEGDAQVHYPGFVENLEDYFHEARVSIVPLLFGSGMKVKLLNAMFRGIPSVTTTVGAEGIDIQDKKHIYISDDPMTFAEGILHLMKDQKTWEDFRNKSRRLAIEKYSWDSLIKKHRLEIDELIER